MQLIMHSNNCELSSKLELRSHCQCPHLTCEYSVLYENQYKQGVTGCMET
jgi:hypothetical protein